MRHAAPDTRMRTPCRTRGFTLVELLVAIAIVVVIAAIVYASLTSVVNATDLARVTAEEMRMRQFLIRSFTTNLTAVYADPALMNENYQFLGIAEKGTTGPMDSVEFCSSAPLSGALSPPGLVKRVRYAVVTESDSGFDLDAEASAPVPEFRSGLRLEASEHLMTANASSTTDSGRDLFSDSAKQQPAAEEVSPTWSVPVDSLSLDYFDGEDWVDEWDSVALGRMPWCVRVRINYARTEEEADADREAGIDPEKDPDFEMVIPIPLGAGVVTDAATWLQSSGIPVADAYTGATPPDGAAEPEGGGRDTTRAGGSGAGKTTGTDATRGGGS